MRWILWSCAVKVHSETPACFQDTKPPQLLQRRHLKCGAHVAENPNACRYVCALQRRLPFPAGTVMLVIPTPALHILCMINQSYFLTRALK